MVELIVIALLAGGLWILYKLFFVAGDLGFWQVVLRHPEQAWAFFHSHPSWFVDHKPSGVQLIGPYKVINPRTGGISHVWCVAENLQQSQQDFMAKLNQR